jgi:hypothetical protein
VSVSIVKVFEDGLDLSDLIILEHSDVRVVVVNLEAALFVVVFFLVRGLILGRSLWFLGATSRVEVFLIHFNI